MKEMGFIVRSEYRPTHHRVPMAEIRIAGGGVHLVPAERRLIMAVRFENGFSMQAWDSMTPQERQDYRDAVDWLCQLTQRLKLEDAGV